MKGCNCKKTSCLKKYCECFNAGLECNENCQCEECKNCQNKANGFLYDTSSKKQKYLFNGD